MAGLPFNVFDPKDESFQEMLFTYQLIINCEDKDLFDETTRFLDKLTGTIPDLKEQFARHLEQDIDERFPEEPENEP
jgi:hypothetical protein